MGSGMHGGHEGRKNVTRQVGRIPQQNHIRASQWQQRQ